MGYDIIYRNHNLVQYCKCHTPDTEQHLLQRKKEQIDVSSKFEYKRQGHPSLICPIIIIDDIQDEFMGNHDRQGRQLKTIWDLLTYERNPQSTNTNRPTNTQAAYDWEQKCAENDQSINRLSPIERIDYTRDMAAACMERELPVECT
eukprot:3135553-Ditylum_brightwellii.AAC.1